MIQTRAENIDHNRLFKELLSTFFWEFLELFLPDVIQYMERDSISFLPEEVFTDVTSGERRKVDLLAPDFKENQPVS